MKPVVLYPQSRDPSWLVSEITDTFAELECSFVSESGLAYDFYGMKEKPGVAIIRPGGFVGAVVDGAEGVNS